MTRSLGEMGGRGLVERTPGSLTRRDPAVKILGRGGVCRLAGRVRTPEQHRSSIRRRRGKGVDLGYKVLAQTENSHDPLSPCVFPNHNWCACCDRKRLGTNKRQINGRQKAALGGRARRHASAMIRSCDWRRHRHKSKAPCQVRLRNRMPSQKTARREQRRLRRSKSKSRTSRERSCY